MICARKILGLAMMVYYRRRILRSAGSALTLGVGPVIAMLFLGWVVCKAIAAASAPQNWSLAGVLAAGVVLMLVARLGLKSPFFSIAREADDGEPMETEKRQRYPA